MPNKLNRRKFLKQLGSVAAPLIAAPMVIRAEEKTWKWKMVTTWPKNFPGLGTGANDLAKNIENLSGGRIKIHVYGAGELVPAMGVFDAVSKGTAELGHGASYYWQGKAAAAPFFSAIPFGLNASEMSAWLNFGGAQKIWDEVYAPFGLQAFSAGNTGVQMGGWFNKEINTVADFKGLKMRMPGLGGQVLSELGSAVVTLSGGEIFQAMKMGTIDATEWVGPYNDLAFGLYKAAKFYYWPGWHEPGTTLECMINKKAFQSLPGDLQNVIRVSCQASTENMLAEFNARNSTALDTLIDQHKVKLKKFPDPVLKKLLETSRSVVSEVAKKDPLAKKAFQSFEKFKKSSMGWNKISEEAFSLARALK